MTRKTILITGSSCGLGFEIAKCLDQRGMRIILTGRTQEKLDRASEQLSKKTDHLMFLGDLTHEDVLFRLTHMLAESNIVPDVIIHNVGGKVEKDEHPLTIDVSRKSMQLNVEIALGINSFFLPRMIERQCGRIIHISSDASLSGQSAPGYALAKAAINGYVKSAARFYAKYNIMLCAILPGVFEHEGSSWAEKKISQPEYYQKKLDQLPLGRIEHPKETAVFVSDIACSDSMVCAGSLIQLTAAYL